MSVRMSRIGKEFSPSEAAAITGVSVDLQRDWRRRGLLPENKEGKWTRFNLDHIIEMSVMKVFADAGFSVSYVAECASMAILPTLARMMNLPGAVVFEGDEVRDDIKEMAISRTVVGARGRYLVMVKNPESGSPDVLRCEGLETIDRIMTESNVAHCTILDCVRLANTVADRAGLPLMRIEVEADEPPTNSDRTA